MQSLNLATDATQSSMGGVPLVTVKVVEQMLLDPDDKSTVVRVGSSKHQDSLSLSKRRVCAATLSCSASKVHKNHSSC